VTNAPLGVEDESRVLADIVVWKVRVVDEDHDQIGSPQLTGITGDAMQRRVEVGLLGNPRVVRSHVSTQGDELLRDQH
jgi:hypothetical protein